MYISVLLCIFSKITIARELSDKVLRFKCSAQPFTDLLDIFHQVRIMTILEWFIPLKQSINEAHDCFLVLQ